MRSAMTALVLVAVVAMSGEGAVRRRAVRSPGPPPGTPPVAVADSYEVLRDVALTVQAAGVLSNDSVNGATISGYGAVTGAEQTNLGTGTGTAQGGSVSLAATGSFVFTPAPAFIGNDSFKYTLTNSGGNSTATVNVRVLPPPPVAVNDTFSATQNTVLNNAAPGVLANDTLEGSALVTYGLSGTEQSTLGSDTPTTQGGAIRINADGSFRYAAATGFTGSDSFQYVITNAGGSSKATVTVTVQASNAVDFTVTSPGFFFQFTGVTGSNPVLTLTRGRTYRFRVTTSSVHPFEILDAPPGSVTNNNISNGTLTFTVPNTPGSYRYNCSLHAFGNVIDTVP